MLQLGESSRLPYADSVKHVLLLALVACLCSSCHQNKQAEGPLERAGKNVDNAAHKTGHALETAAQKTGAAAERAADATGDALQKAGKKLQGEETRAAPADSTKKSP
jgi:hypothetical protein